MENRVAEGRGCAPSTENFVKFQLEIVHFGDFSGLIVGVSLNAKCVTVNRYKIML